MKISKCTTKNKNLLRLWRIAIEQKGFSLVELLVTTLIATIVGMAGYVIFSSSNWSYKVQEDVSEAQQNARVAMDRLARDIRTAGFGLPDPPFSLSFTNLSGTLPTLPNPLTSPVTVTNSTTDPDTITILGIGYEAGVLMQGGDAQCNGTGDNFICLCKASAVCPADFEEPDSFFSSATYQSNRRYISINGATFIELTNNAGDHTMSTGTGSSQRTKMKLLSPATLDRDYPDNTPVHIIQAVQYTIADDLTGCSISNPCLVSRDYTMLRGGSTPGTRVVVAENIEDIQFAFGIDANPRDGKIDYSAGYDASAFSNDPTDDSSIIAVRANIAARTRGQDPKGGTGFKRPLIEDRPEGAADGYRRRILTNVIKLRNPRQGS